MTRQPIGYWVRFPEISHAEHMCGLPSEEESRSGALWRCTICWSLWLYKEKRWTHAPIHLRLRYRSHPTRPSRTTAMLYSIDGERPAGSGAWSAHARSKAADLLRKR